MIQYRAFNIELFFSKFYNLNLLLTVEIIFEEIFKKYFTSSLTLSRENGLTVTMRSLTYLDDIDTTCREDPQSIKIALHHPAEVPLKTNFITVPFNQTVQLMVKPKITKTLETVKSYDPEV
jgi:hypothetical protein